MAGYAPSDWDYSRRYLREEAVDDRDPRYFNARGEFIGLTPSRDLVPRAREGSSSNVSVNEIRRDGRDSHRARSAEPGYYLEDGYEYRRSYESRHHSRHDSDYHSHSRRGGSSYGDDDRERERERERKHRHKHTFSTQDKLIAAVAGAALLVGGKELYDRHEAKEEGTEVQRNPLSSAALAGFGALAAYQGAEYYSKQQAKKDQTANYILHHGRDGQTEYYSSDDEGDSKGKKSHRNFLESALAATGLGAAVKTLTGAGDDKRSDTRSRGGSPAGSRSVRSRSGSRSGTGANKIQKAAMASLLAGATEAFRVAKEPGGWRGEKTKRILTAAAGAATVDAAHGSDHGKLGLAESVIGGLVGNRLINGSKNDIEEDRLTGRSRSRSRARSHGGGNGGGTGLAALATAGLGALGAKKVLDRSTSRSRGRDDSYDSGSRRERSRSRSVVDKARSSLAKLGIGSAAVDTDNERRRRDYDDYDERDSRRSYQRDDGIYDDDRGYARSRDHESDRGHRSAGRDRWGEGRASYGPESDLGDSSEDERRAKKMRGKQMLTTGLAAIATVHSAHGVYQSMEKRKTRQKAVKEGRLSPAEAKKLKTKAIMQDAASVGIAALGIKGAVSELKDAGQMTHECNAFRQEKARRHEKRLERRKRLGDRQRSSSWSTPSSSRHGGHPGRYYDADSEYGPPLRRDSSQ